VAESAAIALPGPVALRLAFPLLRVVDRVGEYERWKTRSGRQTEYRQRISGKWRRKFVSIPRRSREVTHLCSDRVTRPKNTPCQRARSQAGDIIRAGGAQVPGIPQVSRTPRRPCPSAEPLLCGTCAVSGRFGGSLLASKPESLLASAEGQSPVCGASRAGHPQNGCAHLLCSSPDLRHNYDTSWAERNA
jgi:hypothetical protein